MDRDEIEKAIGLTRKVRIPRMDLVGNKNASLRKTINFNKGKQHFSPDGERRKMEGLLKAWGVNTKLGNAKHKGKVMTLKRKREKKLKLHATIAKEARDIQNKARGFADAAMDKLADMIASPLTQDTVRATCIALMFDRAYGRPNQTQTNVNVDANAKPSELPPEELDARITKTLDRVKALTERAGKAPQSPQPPTDLRKLN